MVIDENDPIVPPESASIKGAKEIRIAKGSKEALLINLPEALVAHGRPLKDGGVIAQIGEHLGEDLADRP